MQNAIAIDNLFEALGDATRRRIIAELRRGPKAASKLVEPLGISLTAVIQHLTVLEKCKLIKTQKQGRTRTCELDSAGFTMMESWIDFHRSSWETKLDALGEIVDP